MWKKVWKKYGKIVTAAVFLTAAGFCYGLAGSRGGEAPLEPSGTAAAWEVLGSLADPGNGRLPSGNGADPADGEPVSEGGVNSSDMQTGASGVFVHICGEVNGPGVYELPEESRIFEAVEAAGGFTSEAAQDSLNLAEKVRDGMQIVVLSKEEASEAAARVQESGTGLVNLNTAAKEELMTLKGIGESRADDIIRYREESGGFQTIEEIMNVPGIKEAGFQKIKDSITV